MQKSSVIFYNNNEANACYYTHSQLGLINTYQSAANSVMVSLAQYLVWKFPNLLCPGISSNRAKCNVWISTFPNYATSKHSMCSSWINIFIEAVESGNALRNNEDCFYKVQISQDYGDLLQSHGFQKVNIYGMFKWNLILPQIKEEINNEQTPTILFATCSQQEVRPFFYGEFFNNENWKSFHILKGELPNEQDFIKSSTIIVPGGEKSVYQNNEYIDKFSQILHKALVSHKKLKYLGICFGAQLLVHSMGGSVGKSYKLHCELCTIKVQQNKSKMIDFKFLEQFFNSPLHMVHQYHGDQIKNLPPNFQVIATSHCTKYQVIISLDGRMLGIQAHPQYSVQRSIMYQLHQHIQKGSCQHKISKIIQRKDEPDDPSIIRRTISMFLKDQ